MRGKTLLLVLVVISISACSKRSSIDDLAINRGEKHITILSSNDIHGGVEPSIAKNGKSYGGMAMMAAAFSAIREGLKKKYPDNSTVVAVDGGDQFQGTLISNYDEGQLVFATMNEVGYDVVIPGNHDYDFGPIGWLVDSADPAQPNQFRESLNRLVGQAKFPLVSANTFYKDSLVDTNGKKVDVDNRHCKPKHSGAKVDWSKAKQPEFLKPYVIVQGAGVRVALIGIDHPNTPETTTAVNVSDLCFGDEFEHYMRLRKALDSKADIFVLVMHNGDANTDKSGTKLSEKLTAEKDAVHAVISAHTHFTYNNKVNGVPLIQSGSGGTSFGRVDLVWDAGTKKVIVEKTKSYAGVMLFPDGCDERSGGKDFCKVDAQKKVTYEGVPLVANEKVKALIAKAREVINPMAKQKLATAKKELTRDRITESTLANEMTDVFLEVSKAQIATLNTGGLRANLSAGEITYEDFFKVIPFNNRGVIVGPMPRENLLSLIRKSIKTCGVYGALMQAGLRVTYRRDCRDSVKHDGIDPNATLIRVETRDGVLIYDQTSGVNPSSPEKFEVATLDFIARGGDNYEGFKGLPQKKDLNIIRETMKDHFLKKIQDHNPTVFEGKLDDRWKNETAEFGPPPTR